MTDDVRPVRISVCIPAYNRADRLPELLDSILNQRYLHYDVVICEDASPQRGQIRAVVAAYEAAHPGRLHYFENAENFGYDGNFRELIRRATGDYCFIMGNDDVMAADALETVASALARYPDVGFILRTVAYFERSPAETVTVARYFANEMYFEPGLDTVVTFFRRVVSVSGLVIHREAALRHETARFDGTLFYQQHLAAHILMEMHGVYLPQVLAHFRMGGVPEFGTSARERGRFTPGVQPPDTSLKMLQAHLDIAEHAGDRYGTALRRRVHRDLGRNMYPAFKYQAHIGVRAYLRYYRDLMRMGFWRYPLFHAFGLGVLVLGRERADHILYRIRARLGHTPLLGERPRPVAMKPAPDRPD